MGLSLAHIDDGDTSPEGSTPTPLPQEQTRNADLLDPGPGGHGSKYLNLCLKQIQNVATSQSGAAWAGVLVMIHAFRLKAAEVNSMDILTEVLKTLPKADELSNA